MRVTFFTALLATAAIAAPTVQQRSNAIEKREEAKRQLGLDIGGLLTTVTSTTDGLLAVLTPVLSTVTGTVGDADSIVKSILDGAEADVDAALADVQAKVQGALDIVSALSTGDLSGATAALTAEIDSTIATVEGLLADVQSLTGLVDAGSALDTVTGLVQQLLDVVVPLTSAVSIVKA